MPPSGQVAFGVGPSDNFGHRNDVGDRLEIASFGNGKEFVVVNGEPRRNKMVEKVENAGILPLVFAEGLKIHEEINQVATETIVVEPSLVFFDSQRPF